MTNAHYHEGDFTMLSSCGEEFRFVGVHPWDAEDVNVSMGLLRVRDALSAEVAYGVGEIGLDRLKTRAVTPAQRLLFERQLEVAAEFHRPVVLHGAKCWGDVVRTVRPYAGRIPSFLFHGFSRSGGLIPEIVSINGFVSVGKAVLNDHAVNYRELVKLLPLDRLLVETDDAAGTAEARDLLLAQIFAKVADLTSLTERQLDENCARMLHH